ncbi:MAG: ATP-binding protein [Dehalococcoidales bacterium]|nr:ATP-binding protein [Dehalococcoidales bacterium]
MPRSDLLLSLAKSGSQGDLTLFRRTLEAIIAEERAKSHNILADRLASYLSVTQLSAQMHSPNGEKLTELYYENSPSRALESLILPSVVLQACRELIEEHQRADLLRSYNIEPRHMVLLTGPPGNGKTALAEAIANSLMLPWIVVRYEGIIGSFLGETANRLAKLLDYVRTRKCLLFLDEFDTLAKERGDIHETGEIKRVVSSLLLQLDRLPSHVLVITATNHPELLDRAVWRRFQIRLYLPPPTRKALEEWFEHYQKSTDLRLGFSPRTLADKLYGMSFAEVEEFCADINRRRILKFETMSVREIVKTRLEQWQASVKCKEESSNA